MGRPSPNTYFRDWPFGRPTPTGDPEVAKPAVAAALMAKLAWQLAEARTRSRWSTQAALFKKAGVGRHTLSRIEAGSTWPDLEIVLKLCAALDLRLELVDDRTGEPVDVPGKPGE